MWVHCTRYKNMHLFRRHFAPLWPRAPTFQHVRFEFGLRTPMKFYPDPLRFAGVIREKPILSEYNVALSCIWCMTAYSKSWSRRCTQPCYTAGCATHKSPTAFSVVIQTIIISQMLTTVADAELHLHRHRLVLDSTTPEAHKPTFSS